MSSSKKAKKTNLAAQDAMSMEDLRGKWTRYIEPGETAFIGRDVSLHVVMKNLGPGLVAIPIGPRGDLEKLIAGTLLVRVIIGDITIHCMEDKPALVAMEFFPWSRR
jgi:hypothetical protein